MSLTERLQELAPPVSEFGTGYEEGIITFLLACPDKFVDHMEFLIPQLFKSHHCMANMLFIRSIWERTGFIPTARVLREELSRELTIEDLDWKEIVALPLKEPDPREIPLIYERLEEFIRKRTIDRMYSDEAIDAAARGDATFVEKVLASLSRIGHSYRFTLKQLVDKHKQRREPIVDGLFRVGDVVNIISYSKVGKSWLAYSLGLSVIAGRTWLGKLQTSPGNVLLIDNELHEDDIAHRVPIVANALNLADEQAESLDVWSLRKDPKTLSQLQPMLRAIPHGKYKLIILDAKYRFVEEGASENDNAAETRFYNRLNEMAAQSGAAIVLIHHATKGDQSGKRVTDVGSGAGAQSRAADCHLVLREHEEEGACVLAAAVRSFPPLEPMVLRWEFPLWRLDASLNPTRLANELSRKQRDRETEAREAILKMLQEESATARQLRDHTSFSADRVTKTINKLKNEGLVGDRTVDRFGNKCSEYFLIGLKLADGSDHQDGSDESEDAQGGRQVVDHLATA